MCLNLKVRLCIVAILFSFHAFIDVQLTMVLAEKNNENARNGRRSRGPSPNGHVQAESTSEDESTGMLNTRIVRNMRYRRRNLNKAKKVLIFDI